jgi:hypothetical protein
MVMDGCSVVAVRGERSVAVMRTIQNSEASTRGIVAARVTVDLGPDAFFPDGIKTCPRLDQPFH